MKAKDTEFEQRMFDIIATQNVAAAAINCMDIAKEYAKTHCDCTEDETTGSMTEEVCNICGRVQA